MDPENRSWILLAKSGSMDQHNRINIKTEIMVFKCLINLAPPPPPQYMTSMFKYVDNKINTCNCLRAYREDDLQIPARIHKMVFVDSFAL